MYFEVAHLSATILRIVQAARSIRTVRIWK
jgi:hypothetical protein